MRGLSVKERGRVAVALEFLVNEQLRDYQQEWLRLSMGNKLTAIMGARQIGKTYTNGLIVLMLAMGVRLEGGFDSAPADVLVLSKSLRDANNYLRGVREHIQTIEDATGVQIRHGRLGSESRIALVNGSYIQSLPGSPRALQGFTGHVFVDELAAGNYDPEELIAQAVSVTSSKPEYRLTITTNQGTFESYTNKLFTSEEEEWALRRELYAMTRTNIHDAYGGELPQHLKDAKILMSPNLWRRWYENEAIEGDDVVFDSEMIRLIKPYIEDFKTYRTFVGIDPGFTGDACGFAIVKVDNRTGAIWVQAEHLYESNMASLEAVLEMKIKEANPYSVFIDQGLVGYGMANNLRNKYPRLVQMANTSRDSRQQGIEYLIQQINSGLFATSDMVLIADMKSVYVEDDIYHLPRRKSDVVEGRTIHADGLDASLLCIEGVMEIGVRSKNTVNMFADEKWEFDTGYRF